MEKISQLIEELKLDKQLDSDRIPQIDLYIDQVLELFEGEYADTLRNDKEKVLTKTMINNYAKGKVFYPIKQKKYSENHLMLLNFIYQLKGSLSINDIKRTLQPINEKLQAAEGFDFTNFYKQYLQIISENNQSFRAEVEQLVTLVDETVLEDGEEASDDHLKQIMLINALTNLSNSYRRLSEKLIDDLSGDKS